jgi:CRISPR/Cas system CSM-associated protein Csm2 small subunit
MSQTHSQEDDLTQIVRTAKELVEKDKDRKLITSSMARNILAMAVRTDNVEMLKMRIGYHISRQIEREKKENREILRSFRQELINQLDKLTDNGKKPQGVSKFRLLAEAIVMQVAIKESEV